MRILVTNDDGINAPGLEVLQAIAREVAGSDGEVWTVAPAREQSGTAHCISYTNPAMIVQHSERCFSVEGYPADCVLAGIHHVLKSAPPDLVLSGVNRGNNSAENALYSGTLGAALEGALQGVLSVALSQYLGPKNRDLENPFEASAAHGADLIGKLCQQTAPFGEDYPLFYNVNFPPLPALDVQGVKVTPQGRRRNSKFSVSPYTSASKRQFLFAQIGDQQVPTAPGTDAAENLEGYITVTPMRADLTDYGALDALRIIE